MSNEEKNSLDIPKLTIYGRERTFVYAGINRLFINILQENYTVENLKARIPFVNYFNQTYNWWATLSFFMVTKWDKACIDELQDQLPKYFSRCRSIAIVYPQDDDFLKIFRPMYQIVEKCSMTPAIANYPRSRSQIFVNDEEAVSWLLEREPELHLARDSLLTAVRPLV